MKRKMKFELILSLGIIFLIFMSSTGSISTVSQPSAISWGWPSHHAIVYEALTELDDDWVDVFEFYSSLMIGGSTYPDSVGDWDNHLWYPNEPDGGGYTAPIAIQRWMGFLINNLTIGNYEDAVFAAGVVSHYISDISWAVHTSDYWDGHSAIETAVNSHIDEFTFGELVIYDNITTDTVDDLAKEWATYANQYYDLAYDAYPDSTVSDNCVTNATLKAAIEDMLTRSASNVLSVWVSAIKVAEFLPPTINIESSGNKVWIDNRTTHDYYDELGNFGTHLSNLGFDVIYDDDGLTDTDLEDVVLVVITAIYDGGAYSGAELIVLNDWIEDDSFSKTIFVTGRGDFANIDYTAIDDVLIASGSNVRMNDDNVYTVASDPKYYQDWYVYTDNIRLPNSEPLPDDVTYLNHFSPNSLYFTAEYTGEIVSNGTIYDYQTDQNSPAPSVIWDNTDDGVGGTVIPLLSVEENETSNAKIAVFSDTAFSDFSFSASEHHDNLEYIEAFLGWALGIGSDVSPFGPRVEIEAFAYDTEGATAINVPFNLDYMISSETDTVGFFIDDVFIVNITSLTSGLNAITDSTTDAAHTFKLIGYANGYSFETSISEIAPDIPEPLTNTSTTTTTDTDTGNDEFTPSFVSLITIASVGSLVTFRKKK